MAPAQFSPGIAAGAATSESQRRALTRFPRVDDGALRALVQVKQSWFDVAANRYVWLFAAPVPVLPPLTARFLDEEGRELHRAMLGAGAAPDQLQVVVPAAALLEQVDEVRLVAE